MTEKLDVRKSLDSYRAARGVFRVLEIPTRSYLMIDGQGDPNTSPSYGAALEALYSVAYRLKFASKRELGRDYVVPPLEGLWWADDLATFTTARDKSHWRWTMMIFVPEWIPRPMYTDAVAGVRAKTGAPAVDRLRLAELDEGLCVQTLHVGSFDDEGPVLEELHHRFVPDQGLELHGTHHEVYMSDPRRTAPEKLRTILRQPVRPRPAS